jgi:GNAT superfamily N-acetyltransferase
MFGARAFLFADVAEAFGKQGPRLIGYALSHDCFTTDFGERGLYMVDLYVDVGWRRSGAGKRLMAAVAARARRRGATHLWWSSMPGNLPARRFNASLGANSERIVSHALFGQAFDKLAARGR